MKKRAAWQGSDCSVPLPGQRSRGDRKRWKRGRKNLRNEAAGQNWACSRLDRWSTVLQTVLQRWGQGGVCVRFSGPLGQTSGTGWRVTIPSRTFFRFREVETRPVGAVFSAYSPHLFLCIH